MADDRRGRSARGDLYVFVDADAIGLALGADHDARLIDTSVKARRGGGEKLETVHPERPDSNSCYQVPFTSEKKTPGDYRQTVLCPPGALDRSPCGTGTSARVALRFARGEIGLREPRKFEGPVGTCMIGQAVAEEGRNGCSFITPPSPRHHPAITPPSPRGSPARPT